MIREDVFPATVVIVQADFEVPEEGLHSRPPTEGAAAIPIARVTVSHDRIWVVKDDVSGPLVVFSQEIDPTTHYKGSVHVDSTITTVNGIKLAWRKDTQCGCGSRLRSWRPYKTMGSVKDPGPEDD